MHHLQQYAQQHFRNSNTLDDNADLPFISVLVPARNEEQYIVGCLDSLLAQDYSQEHFEIIVLNGASTDRTGDLVRQIEAAHRARIRYLENPGIRASAALNIGLRAAVGDIVVRMDAHAKAPAHYLSTVTRHLLEKRAFHVGVKLRTVGEGFWGACIAQSMSNPFGTGGSKHRCSTKDGWDEAGCLGAFWRAKVLALGGFDESFVLNEDNEFIFRIQKAGGRVYRTAEVEIEYYCRKTLTHLWIQFYRYGLFKPPIIWKHRLAKLRHFVPPLFVLTCVLLGLAAFWVSGMQTWLAVLGGGYLIASFFFAVRTMRTVHYRVAFALPVAFAVMHFSYGCGFLVGTIRLWIGGLLKWSKKVSSLGSGR